TAEPRYSLPDEITRVQSQGMADGLRSLFIMLTEQFPDGPPVKQLFQSSLLIEKEKIESTAECVAEIVASCEERPIANDIDLFYQHYSPSYVAGFHFGLYALPRGLMEICYSVPEDRHYELVHRFAWERFTKELTPDKDEF